MANANNTDSVVIGHMAEGNTGSIVIGKDSVSSGNNSIVIGKNANLFEDNSILLDATDNDTSGKFYVKPIRELNAPNMLCYNTGSCEVTYKPSIPDGTCYSDYLYWNTGTNKWEAGGNEVHIGCGAGKVNQGFSSIAIGNSAGQTNQGSDCIAIGELAGQTNQDNNTIILNSSGLALNSTNPNSFYVKPIRNAPGPLVLCYNTGTCEITYETEIKKQIPAGCGLTYSDKVQLEFKTNSNALTGALGVERNHIIVNDPCNPSPSHFYLSQVHGESGYGIVMGQQNTLTGETKNSTIAGGYNNEIEKSNYAFIGGGKGNTAYGNYSNIVGGKYNDLKGTGTFIGGGQYNTIYLSKDSKYSFIGSGSNNIVDGEASNIIGGEGNTIENKRSNIVGGVNNKIYSIGSNIVGGFQNKINNNSDYSSIVGGQCNTITGAATYAFIGGGQGNTASGLSSFIGGGEYNIASGSSSFIGGGQGNTASGFVSVIGGGKNNMTFGKNSFIGGGENNMAMNRFTFIGGGEGNTADSSWSNIVGGLQNKINNNSDYSSIIGGKGNTITGAFYAFIGGGQDNTATGTYSIAFGQKSNANKNYSAVFGLNAAGTSAPAENTLTIGVGNSGQKRGIYYLDAPSDTGTNLVITSDGQIVKDTKSTLPVGTCYSDYLYWDTGSQQWENGNNDSKDRVHIGCGAGQFNQQDKTIAIGDKAGRHIQQGGAVAIGSNAGETNQREAAIAIGIGAGNDNQGEKSIAIGADSGKQNQETGAISIGLNAGENNQKQNSIAIGQKADLNGCNNNTIILNATGGPVNSTGPSSFYVKPVRELNAPNMLCYNTGTGEISYQAKNLIQNVIQDEEIKFAFAFLNTMTNECKFMTPIAFDTINIRFIKINNIVTMLFLNNLSLKWTPSGSNNNICIVSTNNTFPISEENVIPPSFLPLNNESFETFQGIGPDAITNITMNINTSGQINFRNTLIYNPNIIYSIYGPLSVSWLAAS
jgi:hypothetical protein